MDRSSELAGLLRTRRAGLTPDRAGLPADGHVRRVSGLRRDEVALLAGVSAEYRIRPEQGRAPTGPQRVRPGLYLMPHTLDHVPAFVLGRRTDVPASRLAELVGELTVRSPEFTLCVHNVEPGSDTALALGLLDSWTAPQHDTRAAPMTRSELRSNRNGDTP